ncbi:Actin- protein 6 [Blyttiomyces sp. JEL0837]|nr:Actin- protein 6 [Blyttiomyces sp. JEL0837]
MTATTTTGANICARQSGPFSVPPECMLVIDAGFSSTNIVPVVRGGLVEKSLRRINVGGKLLTNHLKELISYRQWNMMDETYIVNHIKKSCCYVALDFKADLEASKKGENAIEYVLPDFTTSHKGYTRQPDDTTELLADSNQTLRLTNERFAIPEILFHPSDIGEPLSKIKQCSSLPYQETLTVALGLEQAGVAETVFESIMSTSSEFHGPLFANILVIGGNARFPGFSQRLSMVPVEYVLQIHTPTDPVRHVWQSGSTYAATNPDEYFQLATTKAQYMENGLRNSVVAGLL